MLKVNNISVHYGNRQVLDGVSLEVKEKEIILLSGTNGSGKSTLLNAIYGIIPKDMHKKGQSVYFNKEDITNCTPSQLPVKKLMIIPQKNNLFGDLTVQENLELAGYHLEKKRRREAINQVYEMFNELHSNQARIPIKLSGGEKQLLAFAMIYLRKPKMVLLDEPFAGLNANNVNILLDRIRTLNNEGIAFLIVEHKIEETLKIAHQVIGLKEGKIVYKKCKNNGVTVEDIQNHIS